MSDTSSLQTLTSEFENKLNALIHSDPSSAGVLTARRSPREFRSRLCRVERLACEVESVQVDWNPSKTLQQQDLEFAADYLASSVTYLEEELAVIERSQGQLQLRSREPFKNGQNDRLYYELILDRQRITVRRYLKSPAVPRRGVPMVIARKLLARLGHDLLCQPLFEK